MLTKTRHNKKRNTAFLYEALVRELTKCIVAKDQERRGIIVSLVREHFAKGTLLRKELELYKALYETNSLETYMCEKLIYEVKRSHNELDKGEIFKEQTELINKINKMLSKNVFTNFVPNYKDLATISQILNPDVSVKHRVLLENTLVQSLSLVPEGNVEEMAPMDNLVYKTFVKNFNEQYSGKLSEAQKEVLNRYIASFHDDGVELKVFLNEELGRLKSKISESMKDEEISNDNLLLRKSDKVLSILEGYANREVDEAMIKDILKIQTLVEELGA